MRYGGPGSARQRVGGKDILGVIGDEIHQVITNALDYISSIITQWSNTEQLWDGFNVKVCT